MDKAEIFRALGDPVRLKIVQMLAENGEICVCRIVEELDMGQPAISHHLARLRYAGLITGRKRGQWVDYSLNLEVFENEALGFLSDLVRIAKEEKPKVEQCGPGMCGVAEV